MTFLLKSDAFRFFVKYLQTEAQMLRSLFHGGQGLATEAFLGGNQAWSGCPRQSKHTREAHKGAPQRAGQQAPGQARFFSYT